MNEQLTSINHIKSLPQGIRFQKILWVMMLMAVVIMFLPWTQNIWAPGNVTALRPDQRPATIHSMIDGQVKEWRVAEGDFVAKGDTVLIISELGQDYLDPMLIPRTEQQLVAKESGVSFYMEKIKSLDQQVDALNRTRMLKLEQAENKLRQAALKIKTDSINLTAAINQSEIAEAQMKRADEIYAKGLISKTDWENRGQKRQKTLAEKIDAENQLLVSKNQLINARIELNTIENEFRDKISKAESEKYAAISAMYEAEAEVTGMQNKLMNVQIRSGFYCITAPQSGYITKAIIAGIGETVKKGQPLMNIVPEDQQLAAEVFVDPVDLPLLQLGSHVSLRFDGWPAVVFSGWPGTSFGTFHGEITAIDRDVNQQGKYRVLIKPSGEVKWPEPIRVGAGVQSYILLNTVRVGYELWRNINGFPPDFYQAINGTIEKSGSDEK
ncbi:MAG: HlyD family efflux transporter periplasmic adaptor subunit [Flavobacteriales bacterium]